MKTKKPHDHACASVHAQWVNRLCLGLPAMDGLGESAFALVVHQIDRDPPTASNLLRCGVGLGAC